MEDGGNSSELAAATTPKAQVIAWLLDGQRDADITAAIAEKFPWLRADDVLAEVVAHFEEVAHADKTVYFGWCLEALRDLYRRALAAGELETALRAVKELAALAQRKPGVRKEAEPSTAESAAAGKAAGERQRKRLGRKKSGGSG